MKKCFKVSLSLLAAFAISSANAEPVIEKVIDEPLLNRVQASLPGKVSAVYVSELPGIYEVHTESKQVLYTDENGKLFIIGGQLVDFKQRVNYTQDRKALTQLVPWDSLPHTAGFTVKKGNGERKVAVFTDPDCPFCKRLEVDLKDVDNVTISYFMLPIDRIHPKARAKAGAVLCAPDKAKAWSDLIANDKLDPSAPTCLLPIDQISKFAVANRIGATPTLVNSAGYVIEGAPKKDRLEAFLNGKL